MPTLKKNFDMCIYFLYSYRTYQPFSIEEIDSQHLFSNKRIEEELHRSYDGKVATVVSIRYWYTYCRGYPVEN